MRIFPLNTRRAQEDLLSDTMSDILGKYWYTGPIDAGRLDGLREVAARMGYRFQYLPTQAGLMICRVAEKDVDKLGDGERGKYLLYDDGHGFHVYDSRMPDDIIYGDWKWGA
jgi:hypothetical protein